MSMPVPGEENILPIANEEMILGLHGPGSLKILRLMMWSTTALACFLHAWAERFWLSPDGINYLDIANAYLRGDWKSAVNSYWSPFFSWLLVLGKWAVKPSGYWESTFLHLINFVGILVALGAFEYFYSALLKTNKPSAEASGEQEGLSELGHWLLGYGIFLSTMLFVLYASSTTTPDVWICVFTFIAGGLLARIRANGGGWPYFAMLGLTLGCAYLTKSFYFPMSFIFLLAAWLATGAPRKTMRQAILALVVFAIVAGPWIAEISRAKERITFGDAGTMNFAMSINELPRPLHWQGENGTGTPRHAVRQILRQPRLYEYATPIQGTYPPSFDWSYWMEGVKPHFVLRGQLRVLRQALGTYLGLFFGQAEFGMGLAALFFLVWPSGKLAEAVRETSYLWVPGLIGCASYGMVHVEGRLTAAFVLLALVAAFHSLLRAAAGISPRVVLAIVMGMLCITGLRVVRFMEVDEVAILLHPRHVDWEVSEALRAAGVQPGDKVAGLLKFGIVQWAHLAGAKVVAEVPMGEDSFFWAANAETKARVFQAFANAGAKMAVTEDPPREAAKENWFPLGNTGFYGHTLPGADLDNQGKTSEAQGPAKTQMDAR
jgi:hypothetical protein